MASDQGQDHGAEREQFLRYLRENGHRVTQERLTLFDEIFRQHGHIDAEQLLESLKERQVKISRATVYRNLDLLVECGLVTRHRLGRRRYLYEHVHPGQKHDHLVCTECGRVVEFVSPGISALQSEICKAHDFVPSRHSLQIMGICNRCAAHSEEAGGGGATPSHHEPEPMRPRPHESRGPPRARPAPPPSPGREPT